jgi:thiamine biosynthesis lipoprotein
MPRAPELVQTFDCFGSTVTIRAAGDPSIAAPAIALAREIAEDLHARLTRFDEHSELSRLNADPRAVVPASAVLRRFASAVRWAGERSDGLVDATCLAAVEHAGYRGDWQPGAEFHATTDTPPQHDPAWMHVAADRDSVVRPPGTILDSGGLGKGLAADLMANALAATTSWAVDCGGDLRVGGRAAPRRPIDVKSPDPTQPPIHRLHLAHGAIATSGTTRRRWDGGHHLIDPRTGAPADTGIIQVTALASTGLEAEVRAKAALLAGPAEATAHLPDGGVLVHEDGTVVHHDPSYATLRFA